MDPDTTNCVILDIHVVKNNNSQPCHLVANQCKCKVWEYKKLQQTKNALKVICPNFLSTLCFGG